MGSTVRAHGCDLEDRLRRLAELRPLEAEALLTAADSVARIHSEQKRRNRRLAKVA